MRDNRPATGISDPEHGLDGARNLSRRLARQVSSQREEPSVRPRIEFVTFVEDRWTLLVRTAVMLGCTRPDAEDLVQTTLVNCLVHWRKVSHSDDPDAYVHRMLQNTLRSAKRRRWNGEQPTSPLPDQPVSDQQDAVDGTDTIKRLLQSLPADQRAVIILRHVADLSEAQIADALQIPVGTVKSRLSRGIKALSQQPDVVHLRGPS